MDRLPEILIRHPDCSFDLVSMSVFGESLLDKEGIYKDKVRGICHCKKSACDFEQLGASGYTTFGHDAVFLGEYSSECIKPVYLSDEKHTHGILCKTHYRFAERRVFMLSCKYPDYSRNKWKIEPRDIDAKCIEYIKLRTICDIPKEHWSWSTWFYMNLKYYFAGYF